LLPIPQVLLDQMGWKEGDTIDFGLDEEGRYILKKI
jgi:bifunctional DNA-binding transcriptional regulator/antitoxin component of YhaV-PrlF toxin-antitoxin module